MGCQGASLGVFESVPVAGDSGAAWIALGPLEVLVPAAARSALVEHLVVGENAGGIFVDLDVISFGRAGAVISDGFESGDTWRWTATAP